MGDHHHASRFGSVRHVIILAVASLTSLACAAPRRGPASVTSVDISGPAKQHVSESPTDSVAETLVWTRRPSGSFLTYRVQRTAHAYAAVAAAEGVWLTDGRRLFEYATEPVKIPLYSCDHHDPSEPPVSFAEAERATLREGRRAPIEIFSAPQDERANSLDHSVSLLGSVGPYLFMRGDTDAYHCGAHGNVQSEFLVWDLMRGGPATEQFVAGSALRAEQSEAADRFAEEDELLPSEGITLSALRPLLSSAGRLSVQLLFTASTCYACSDGLWSSYTRSLWVNARTLPSPLRPHLPPSDALRAVHRIAPHGVIGGFSSWAPSSRSPTAYDGQFRDLLQAPPN